MRDDAIHIGLTWRDALVSATSVLRPTEGEDAAGDARRLLAHALGESWLDLIKDPARRLSEPEASRLAAMLARRVRGEPVSRIIGVRGFYGRDFLVTAATLDPRPESETLIDAALARIKPVWGSGAGLDILDIGTGTGCLLLTLLAELPDAHGVGIDPSADALAVAHENGVRLGIGDRVRWMEGRFEAIAGQIRQAFPLIVSNPPYIPTADIAGLDRDVRDFDPHLALDGGTDGLDIYRGIARQLGNVAARGWVLIEVGHDQAHDVARLIELSTVEGRLGPVNIALDMAGKQRCVTFEIRD